jgi:hypothetical protein
VSLTVVPVDFDDACEFVRVHHRHHRPPSGHKFSIACANETGIVGVAVVGRPIARMLDDGWTLEVTRLATDGTPHACSCLYAACWRAARAMGYRKVITYILDTEPGTSLKGSGWKLVGATDVARSDKGSWNRPGRPRVDKAPLQRKLRWEMSA